MKNNKLFLKIYVLLIIISIITIILLSVLGNKTRVGYLSEFKFDIDHTLELNDLFYIKEQFTKEEILDEEAIKNYVFTNKNITNYSYRIKLYYYDKIFRHSDIYKVYIDTNKLLNDNKFIKEINMDEIGSPFGHLISYKKIESDKIDNVNYSLKLKFIAYLLPIIIIISLFLLFDFINAVKYIINSNIQKTCVNLIKYDGGYVKLRPEYITVYIIFFPIIILMYQTLNLSFPYYYWWDSTRIYSVDILLASSNIMPEHFFHPNMIPLVLTKYIFIPIGKLLGLISISNIKELENSLNPYLPYVEFTEYILNLIKLLFLLFITFMYINIIKIMDIHKIFSNKTLLFFISLLFLIASSVFVKTIFINNIIRYELIGLLSCSISLYFILLALEQKDYNNKKQIFYLILSGIFSGCAILSKILLVFLSIIIFISYIILNISQYTKNYNYKFNFNKIYKIIIFISASLLLMDILIYIRIPQTAFQPKYDIKLLLIQLIVLSYFITLSIFIYLLDKKKIIFKDNFKLLIYHSSLFIISCLSPILLSFLLPKGQEVFLITYINSYSGYNTVLSYEYNKFLFISIILIIGIIFFSLSIFFLNKNQNFQNKIIYFLYKKECLVKILLSLFLILLSLIFSKILRNDEKDFIISHTMILISFFIFAKNIIDIKIYRNISIIILLIILSTYSIVSLNKFKKYSSLFFTKSSLTYTQDEWKHFTYGFNAKEFVDILEKSYETRESWDTAFYWSKNIKQVYRLLKQIDITNNSLNDTIIANNNSKISIDGMHKISYIDENLKGALILKLNDNTNNVFLRTDYDFYFISNIEYKKNDKRINLTDYNFYINEKKYFVYKLNMDSWKKLDYGYNGNFSFIKNEDFNTGFILINDRLAKGL